MSNEVEASVPYALSPTLFDEKSLQYFSTNYMITNSSEIKDTCQKIMQEHTSAHVTNRTSEDFLVGLEGDTIIRIVLSTVALLVNLLVVIALLQAWNKLRQNIYIFALNVAMNDALMGLVYLGTSLYRQGVINTDLASYNIATAWLSKIQGAMFMSTEVATAANTAFIALAFSKYVTAQLAKPSDDDSRRGTFNKLFARRRSVLLSRKKSYIFSGVVWTLFTIIFLVGLIWNCTDDCFCCITINELKSSHGCAECHYYYKCSFLFQSLKDAYGVICATLFFASLTVVMVMCAHTIHVAGGMGVILPYKIHLMMIRKEKRNLQKKGSSNQTPIRRRNSMQLYYTRNMTHFIIAVTLSYVICRLPLNLVLLIDSIAHTEHLVPVKVVQVLKILAFLQSLINPFILYLKLHRMKQVMNNLLMNCCERTVEVRRGTGSNETRPSTSILQAQTCEQWVAVVSKKKSIKFQDPDLISDEINDITTV